MTWMWALFKILFRVLKNRANPERRHWAVFNVCLMTKDLKILEQHSWIARFLPPSFCKNWIPRLHEIHLMYIIWYLQINAEKSPFLTEKLRIFMLPTLALVKKEKVVDYVVGFDELGGTDDFSTEVSLFHIYTFMKHRPWYANHIIQDRRHCTWNCTLYPGH